MLKFLPAGWVGLMVGGLIAANSSTILTHLNWGASYLCTILPAVPEAGPGRTSLRERGARGDGAVVRLSSALVFVAPDGAGQFQHHAAVGAGRAAVLLRCSGGGSRRWCEIVAMVCSFGVSIVLLFMRRSGVEMGTHRELLLTVILTTICWMATAYLGPRTDRQTLIDSIVRCIRRGQGGARSGARRESR